MFGSSLSVSLPSNQLPQYCGHELQPYAVARRRASPTTSLHMGRRDGYSDGSKGSKRERERKQQDRVASGEKAVGNTYNYVQGGFEEKSAPVAAGNQTSMYAAFDSALRASNYNMFCSPLKPVNAPTQFKASSPGRQQGPPSGNKEASAQKWAEPEEEDPGEVRRKNEAQYRELDKLIGGDRRGLGSDGNRKPMIKKLKKVPVSKEKKAMLIIAEKDSELEEEQEEQVDEFKQQIDEGYEELQKLLSLKPKGKTKRKVDSARFTGNMTQHRIDGSFKAVTMKDPLKRIYATKLKEEAPTVGSSEAIRRPGQPAPAENFLTDAKATVAAPEEEHVVVGDVLASLRQKPDRKSVV